MEALVCRKLGNPTQPISDGGAEKTIMVEKNHPILELGSPTSVRVRVKGTSLNYANYLQILGKYQEKPPLPFIPSSDYSGTVDAVGPAVSKFKVGDPVCSVAALGSFAQFFVIGKVVGAIVIAVARGAEKVEYLKQLGVDHTRLGTMDPGMRSVFAELG
ncbi:hypothetical protein ACFX11_018871 [Malus domestica]